MKKFICLLISFSLILSVYAGNQWRAGTTDQTIKGSTNISDIDTVSFQNMTDPIGRLTANYQEGCKISYASASTITVEAGEIMLQNAAGEIFLTQQNTSVTTISWTDIDTGSESASTTYYLWAFQETATDEDFDVCISASSTAPSSKTYYTRLGSFYNDSSSNITKSSISNDNDYYSSELGDWVSKSFGTSYLASFDGFVTAWAGHPTSPNTYIQGYTDSSNPPTTIRTQDLSHQGTPENRVGITFPVKRGDYYKVTRTNASTGAMFWIPNE